MAPSKVPRSSWTDDDGSGMFGTILNNAELQKIYDGIDQLHSGNAPFETLEVGGGLRSLWLICPDASGIANVDGGAIQRGLVAPIRLGTGTPGVGTYLRGDGAWVTLGVNGTLVKPYTAAVGSAFTAVMGYMYNLVGLGSPSQAYIVLPAVANVLNGAEVGFAMKEAGSWPIYGQTSEQIAGLNPFIFDWPRYSTLTLKADNILKVWDVI